mgnify:CR=1 FL=1
MTPEQHERFHKFIMGDDMDFYEEYVIHLSHNEQEKLSVHIVIQLTQKRFQEHRKPVQLHCVVSSQPVRYPSNGIAMIANQIFKQNYNQEGQRKISVFFCCPYNI